MCSHKASVKDLRWDLTVYSYRKHGAENASGTVYKPHMSIKIITGGIKIQFDHFKVNWDKRAEVLFLQYQNISFSAAL